MEQYYTWKVRFFRHRYELYQNDMLVGELKRIGFRRKSEGELKGKSVLFEAKGFFGKRNLIKDAGNNSVTGEIVYGMWRTKASIKWNEQYYNFRFDGFFHNKWSISDVNETIITYRSRFRKGEIRSYTSNEVLILAGLYIKDFLMQQAAATAAAT